MRPPGGFLAELEGEIATMSWQKQMEQMLGAWTQAQRRLWDNWLEAVRGFSGITEGRDEGWRESYRHNLEAWEASVHQALEAQNQWTRDWTERMLGEQEAPETAVQWINQVQATMRGWTQAQSQLWNAWFDSIKDMDPEQVSAKWETEGREIIRAWQEATERAQEALDEWTRMTGRSPDIDQAPRPPAGPPAPAEQDELRGASSPATQQTSSVSSRGTRGR